MEEKLSWAAVERHLWVLQDFRRNSETNKQTKTFSDVSNEAGDWGIFTLMWSVGNVVASGRTQKTRAKQFSLAEGPATQGVQLWVISNQHSQQLGMLGISGACGLWAARPDPYSRSHLCAWSHLFKWVRPAGSNSSRGLVYLFSCINLQEQSSWKHCNPRHRSCSRGYNALLSRSAGPHFSHPRLAHRWLGQRSGSWLIPYSHFWASLP